MPEDDRLRRPRINAILKTMYSGERPAEIVAREVENHLDRLRKEGLSTTERYTPADKEPSGF